MQTEAEAPPAPVKMMHNSPAQVDPHTQVDLTVKLDDPKGRVESIQIFYRAGSLHDKFVERTTRRVVVKGWRCVSIPPSAVALPFI